MTCDVSPVAMFCFVLELCQLSLYINHRTIAMAICQPRQKLLCTIMKWRVAPSNIGMLCNKCSWDDRQNFGPPECVLFHQGGEVYHSVPHHHLLVLCSDHKACSALSTYPSDLSQDGAPCSRGSHTDFGAGIWNRSLLGMEGWGCRDVGAGGNNGLVAGRLTWMFQVPEIAALVSSPPPSKVVSGRHTVWFRWKYISDTIDSEQRVWH